MNSSWSKILTLKNRFLSLNKSQQWIIGITGASIMGITGRYCYERYSNPFYYNFSPFHIHRSNAKYQRTVQIVQKKALWRERKKNKKKNSEEIKYYKEIMKKKKEKK